MLLLLNLVYLPMYTSPSMKFISNIQKLSKEDMNVISMDIS